MSKSPDSRLARIETAIESAVARGLNSATAAPRLAEAIRYSLLAPGKRIRPRLAIECGALLGLAPEAALACAVSIEMVHCFTLIHDDLPCMDDDDFRRGRPSNHKQFGEATALLAGDALVALAFEALLDAEPHVSAANLIVATRRLAWASGPRGVIGGQALEETLHAGSTLEDLRHMHAGKTGALFEAALLLPKDMAGLSANDPRSAAIDRFASKLGLAFQVMDDLEDAADEATSPLSILHYLPEADARGFTLRELEEATQALVAAWGQTTGAGLAKIADEVASKIRG